MTELSPAAKAGKLIQAYKEAAGRTVMPPGWPDPDGLAAALRAVANQVVPEWAEPIMPDGQSEALILAHMERWGNWRRSSQTRAEILAIAAELAHSNTPD